MRSTPPDPLSEYKEALKELLVEALANLVISKNEYQFVEATSTNPALLPYIQDS